MKYALIWVNSNCYLKLKELETNLRQYIKDCEDNQKQPETIDIELMINSYNNEQYKYSWEMVEFDELSIQETKDIDTIDGLYNLFKHTNNEEIIYGFKDLCKNWIINNNITKLTTMRGDIAFVKNYSNDYSGVVDKVLATYLKNEKPDDISIKLIPIGK